MHRYVESYVFGVCTAFQLTHGIVYKKYDVGVQKLFKAHSVMSIQVHRNQVGPNLSGTLHVQQAANDHDGGGDGGWWCCRGPSSSSGPSAFEVELHQVGEDLVVTTDTFEIAVDMQHVGGQRMSVLFQHGGGTPP
jgi:hypothetical protein